MPKIISECCELVKLCHINHSGSVFLDTVYVGSGKIVHVLLVKSGRYRLQQK